MTVTSGRKWLPLLKCYGLHGSLARMSAALLTSRWGSSAAFLTWKASGTKPRHLLFQLAPSMPRTDATESGLWLTPTASESYQDPVKFKSRMEKYPNGTTVPTLTTQVMWPTPIVWDHKGQGMSRERRETREPGNLCSWTKKYEGSGSLNPAWVEWLMGFPEGWTDLKPSEMPSSRKSSSKSDGPL